MAEERHIQLRERESEQPAEELIVVAVERTAAIVCIPAREWAAEMAAGYTDMPVALA